MIVKEGSSEQSYVIFWVTFVVSAKNNTRIRHSVKKRKLSLLLSLSLLCLFRAQIKYCDDVQRCNI